LNNVAVRADEIGVELFEHLAPKIVDGAVAFIGDDKIEDIVEMQTRLTRSS
jgi:hypothetical protein